MAVAEVTIHFYYVAKITKKPKRGPATYFEIELFCGYECGFDRSDWSIKVVTITPPVLPRIFGVGYQPED